MAKAKTFYLEGKYQAIRWLILMQYGLAILAGIGAAIIVFKFVEEQPIVAVSAIAIAAVVAFLNILTAQMLQLFIDLEWNQRETNELLVQVIENLPDSFRQPFHCYPFS